MQGKLALHWHRFNCVKHQLNRQLHQHGKRWYVYQNERFPILVNGLLIAIFSGAAVAYGERLQVLAGATSSFRLNWQACVAAILGSFCFFLLLRIADEFKDHELDCRYRPYRAVPRGVVTLAELKWLGVVCLTLQLAIALWIGWPLVGILGGVWVYFALMCVEFFAPTWLKVHPIAYMASHMVITPLIGLYALSCQWVVSGQPFSWQMLPFLLTCLGNGLVFELGRKLRCPQDEETGVETYSKLWGMQPASLVWFVALLGAAIATGWATMSMVVNPFITFIFGSLAALAGWCVYRWWQSPSSKTAQWIEGMSATWVLGSYGSLGLLAWLAP